MRDGSQVASRPKLGRPPKPTVQVKASTPTDASSVPFPPEPSTSSTGLTSVDPGGPTNVNSDSVGPTNVNNDAANVNNDAEFQNAAGNRRQVRTTRNRAPNYVF